MIPVCEPTLNGNELKYITDAVNTGWISSAGEYIKKFEEKFAEYCEVKHAVSCCNGTVAIHLALEAMEIGKGDEVIIPTFTMIGTCNAVIYSGARPVLVDSEMETWNINPEEIEKKITPQTKAIMVVHTYGHPVDMDKIKEIAEKHNLFVIEDAAEAHGALYKGRKIGSLSDIACFSFYANKIITTGEGGMVVTNNEKWAERARKLRNHFFGQPRFLHQELGFNYRLTNIQAAVGLAQLEKIEDYIEMRRKNARLYTHYLKNIEGIITPPEKEWVKNVYWMYGILIDKEKFGMSRDQLVEKLRKKGIDTRNFFIGMHKQPAYQKDDPRFPEVKDNFPCSDFLEGNGFYLPSSSHLTEEQIKTVTDTIKGISENIKSFS